MKKKFTTFETSFNVKRTFETNNVRAGLRNLVAAFKSIIRNTIYRTFHF